MRELPAADDPRVLVGFATHDDAGVYRLRDDLALVQTVDILTPVVDDPHTFGRIAAANALSDLYAMGAQPLTALNILTVAPGEAELALAADILRGGAQTLAEAGAAILGGHTLEDPELKYGVCATGTAHPDRILTHAAARPGDALVLTKPLGTGVVATALKGGLAAEDHAAASAASMATLNAAAARVALQAGVHACTDVTGFGLLGHLVEMLAASGVAAVVEAERVPLLPGALDYARMGLLCAGCARTRYHYGCHVDVREGVDTLRRDLLYDPQTSGGLLLAAPEGERLVERLHEAGVAAAACIGRIEAQPPGRVRLL